ncbi:Arc family DNA-binding protein [Streptomyces piniterrae]|uniref:Arc family DNA-binding protein n=1 Tax=Streptomyces piniterrae TaxID=2571125 RepID=A0A4U0NJC9_9ACTN|nr:Arc family DNA-binding protein [Streptomyces piniterrae]TJZ54405.1 Arc family DNA-binding protein [Streptomyces piniterrae]
MDLTPYVDNLRHELAVAADAGGDEARALAERLTAPLESAARLTLLNALSAAMGEVTRDLVPGSVDVRLRGLDPEFVVTPPPGYEAFEEAGESESAPAPVPVPVPVADAEEGGTARINFRLPAHLKARVEEVAGQEGLSVNAWLVRAVAHALEQPGERARPAAGRRARGQQGFTGWVR